MSSISLVTALSTLKGGFLATGASSLVMGTMAKMGFDTATTSALAFEASLGPLLLIIGGIALAIGAVVGAVNLVSNAYNADAIAAEEAAKKTAQLKTQYEEATSAADKLRLTIEGYQEAIKTMQKLDSSTAEYKQSIIEANSKALELLNTNKELYKYAKTNLDNGLITFTQEGLNKIFEDQQRQAINSQIAYTQSQINTSQKQMQSRITNFSRDNNIEDKYIKNILEYAIKNNLQSISMNDILDINEIALASEEVKKALEKNIKPLNGLANSAIAAKKSQELINEQATRAYLQNKGLIDDDGTLSVQEISTLRIMQSQGGIEVSGEERKKVAEEEGEKVGEFFGKNIITKEYKNKARELYIKNHDLQKIEDP